MDGATALKLFDEGAILLLLGVPLGTEIGVDMYSWQSGPNFKGVKMIPPGLHFIYFSPSSGSGQNAPRTGFFRIFNKGEIVVRHWNAETEMFDAEVTGVEELERFHGNKKDLDRFLGPYNQDSYRQWISLSKHMTPSVVSGMQPSSGIISSATALLSEPSDTASRAAKPQNDSVPLDKLTEETLLPDMKPVPGTSMNYTSIHRFAAGSDGHSITRCAMDASSMLEDILSKLNSWKDLIGELQMSFLCFLLGQHYDSFEQWKRLVSLLCTCETAISSHEDLFIEFMATLHFQVKEIPEDFFVDIVSQNNFLTSTLQSLFENITDCNGSSKIKDRGLKFKEHLTHRFDWDFGVEADEDAPVIVDEHGNY